MQPAEPAEPPAAVDVDSIPLPVSAVSDVASNPDAIPLPLMVMGDQSAAALPVHNAEEDAPTLLPLPLDALDAAAQEKNTPLSLPPVGQDVEQGLPMLPSVADVPSLPALGDADGDSVVPPLPSLPSLPALLALPAPESSDLSVVQGGALPFVGGMGMDSVHSALDVPHPDGMLALPAPQENIPGIPALPSVEGLTAPIAGMVLPPVTNLPVPVMGLPEISGLPEPSSGLPPPIPDVH